VVEPSFSDPVNGMHAILAWTPGGTIMNGIIYLVGLVVVVLAVLSFFGLH
jgi:hypothetical protein